MKILHTADIHLGARFNGCTNPDTLRRQLEITFRKIIEKAISEKVDLFLVAGDLFDSERPSTRLIEFVVREFQRLKDNGIEICLVPGTHDKGVVLRGVNIFINSEWEHKEFGDVTVYGINPVQQFPLRALSKRTDTRYHIALLHASFLIPDKTRDEHLMTKEDIENCGMDYIALGHWHNLGQFGKAWYPGAPEPLAIDEIDSGHIIILDDLKPMIIRIGTVRCERQEIDVSGKNLMEIKELIQGNSGQNIRQTVILKGLSDLLDIDELKEELQDDFAQLEIVDNTIIPQEMLNPEEYSFRPVIKRFLELMQEEIKNNNKLAEHAMHYGLALLEGRKDI